MSHTDHARPPRRSKLNPEVLEAKLDLRRGARTSPVPGRRDPFARGNRRQRALAAAGESRG